MSEIDNDMSVIGNEVSNKLVFENLSSDEQVKKLFIKVSSTLYSYEYNYLDYLNHMLVECSDRQIINGCPLKKCKNNSSMDLNEFRNHLIYECTKIQM